jgi:hypothetical protein
MPATAHRPLRAPTGELARGAPAAVVVPGARGAVAGAPGAGVPVGRAEVVAAVAAAGGREGGDDRRRALAVEAVGLAGPAGGRLEARGRVGLAG